MPQISVIVPIYNVEKYLPRCIDSILCQTFTDFELILVDDGSPDNCGAICDEYAAKDSRIRVIHQKNSGVSVARNSAMDIARGEFVAFLDSDDFWETNTLEACMNAARSENADCVLFGFNTYTDEGMVGSHSYITGCYEFSSEQDTIDYFIRMLLTIKHGWEMCFHMFSREIIEIYRIRCCTSCHNFAEDVGFVCRYMLHSGRLVSIPDCLYNYYLRDGSCMRTNGNTPRMDDVNEVSCYLGRDFYKTVQDPSVRKQFPILHFIIANYQMQKLYMDGKIEQIPAEISKLRNIEWWDQNIRGLFSCRQELAHYYGSYASKSTLLFASYLQHGNWKRYCMEKKIMRLPRDVLRFVAGKEGYQRIRKKLRNSRKGGL